MVTSYSPSTGKSWSIYRPPRVPSGRPAWFTYCCAARLPGYTLPVSRAFGLPMACTLTSRAAARYCSRNDGVTFSTSATLSKPCEWSSRGSSASASTSMSSSSRMALLYSRRLSRCSTTEPGFTLPAATLSSDLSSERMKAVRSAAEGCGSLEGGISAPFSLRMTSSQVSPSARRSWVSSTSSASSPAIRWSCGSCCNTCRGSRILLCHPTCTWPHRSAAMTRGRSLPAKSPGKSPTSLLHQPKRCPSSKPHRNTRCAYPGKTADSIESCRIPGGSWSLPGQAFRSAGLTPFAGYGPAAPGPAVW